MRRSLNFSAFGYLEIVLGKQEVNQNKDGISIYFDSPFLLTHFTEKLIKA